MIVEAHITINASVSSTWDAITDIEHHAQFINGIDKIEIVQKPATGLVGLGWRETRMLFGKPATVEKWITESVEREFYKTEAHDGGFAFITTMRISRAGDATTLTSSHDSIPQTFSARLMSIPMMLFFRGTIRKYILKDLNDVKSAAERVEPQLHAGAHR